MLGEEEVIKNLPMQLNAKAITNDTEVYYVSQHTIKITLSEAEVIGRLLLTKADLKRKWRKLQLKQILLKKE